MRLLIPEITKRHDLGENIKQSFVVRQALESWERHLRAVIANEVQEDNVISMVRKIKSERKVG